MSNDVQSEGKSGDIQRRAEPAYEVLLCDFVEKIETLLFRSGNNVTTKTRWEMLATQANQDT